MSLGNKGRCSRCDRPIPVDDWRMDPTIRLREGHYATLCAKCMAAWEREKELFVAHCPRAERLDMCDGCKRDREGVEDLVVVYGAAYGAEPRAQTRVRVCAECYGDVVTVLTGIGLVLDGGEQRAPGS